MSLKANNTGGVHNAPTIAYGVDLGAQAVKEASQISTIDEVPFLVGEFADVVNPIMSPYDSGYVGSTIETTEMLDRPFNPRIDLIA